MANPPTSSVGQVLLGVAWHTDGEEEGRLIKFSLLPTTPLDRVMAAWCHHNQVERAAVCFVWNRRFVEGDDTMESLNMLSENEPVITAMPLGTRYRSPEENPDTN